MITLQTIRINIECKNDYSTNLVLFSLECWMSIVFVCSWWRILQSTWWVLQCVALLCYSALQRGASYYCALHGCCSVAPLYCSVVQCVAVWCSALQRGAVHCSAMQRGASCYFWILWVLPCVASLCCSALQCVALLYSVMAHTTLHFMIADKHYYSASVFVL